MNIFHKTTDLAVELATDLPTTIDRLRAKAAPLPQAWIDHPSRTAAALHGLRTEWELSIGHSEEATAEQLHALLRFVVELNLGDEHTAAHLQRAGQSLGVPVLKP